MMSTDRSPLMSQAPLLGLGSAWLTETTVQAVGCGDDLDVWQHPAGLDFEAETESLAALSPDWEVKLLTPPHPTSDSLALLPDQDVMPPTAVPTSPHPRPHPDRQPWPAAPHSLQTIIEHVWPEHERQMSRAVTGHLLSHALSSSTEPDEHARMIDLGLEDLKTLESMCGISSADAPAPAVQAPDTSAATPPVAVSQPPVKPELPDDDVEMPDDDVQIVEEVQRPAAAVQQQIVIVLTEQQLANIKRSGRIVLSAAGLSTASTATAIATTTTATATTQPQQRQQPKKVAAVRGRVRADAQAVCVPHKPARRTARPRPTTDTSRRRSQTAPAPSPKACLPDWRLSGPAELDLKADSTQSEHNPVPQHDNEIPDDLQDLLLDAAPAGSPLSDADSILEELIAGSVFAAPSPGSGSESDFYTPELSPGFPDRRLSSSSLEPPSPLQQEPQQQQQQWCSLVARGRQQASPRSRPYPDSGPGEQQEREKPGRRPPALTEHERRQRKKEQNKNAATRYRQKKKEQIELVASDQQQLETRNKQLRGKVSGLTRELGYLRQLMRDVLKHRGQVT